MTLKASGLVDAGAAFPAAAAAAAGAQTPVGQETEPNYAECTT